MIHNLGEKNSIANQYMSEIRDRTMQQDRSRFRLNVQRLGRIMATEISRDMRFTTREVETPHGIKKVSVLAEQPVLVTVLRAGFPYFEGFMDVFDQAEGGFVGAEREEGSEEVSIRLGYAATPSLADRTLILIDPMLATGRSLTQSLQTLVQKGKPRFVYIAALVSAPEGIRYLQEHVSLPYSIWTFSVDEMLDHRFYIVPGLGDAGDLSFGEKI